MNETAEPVRPADVVKEDMSEAVTFGVEAYVSAQYARAERDNPAWPRARPWPGLA